MVECNLAKVEVASSNLVSRSKKIMKARSNDRAFFSAFSDTCRFTPGFGRLRSPRVFPASSPVEIFCAEIVPLVFGLRVPYGYENDYNLDLSHRGRPCFGAAARRDDDEKNCHRDSLLAAPSPIFLKFTPRHRPALDDHHIPIENICLPHRLPRARTNTVRDRVSTSRSQAEGPSSPTLTGKSASRVRRAARRKGCTSQRAK